MDGESVAVSGLANMAGSPVGLPDTEIFRDVARHKLIELLNSIPGRKDLILDPDLIIPLERVAGAQLLKKHDVDKIFKLESKATQVGNPQRIYILLPDAAKTKTIADHINADKANSKPRLTRVDVILIPRKLYRCEEILEYEGVFGDVNVLGLDLGFIPLEKDVLSFEIPNYFKDFFLHNDYTWIQTVVSGLAEFQEYFGLIPNVFAQGKGAEMVYVSLQKMLKERKVKNKRQEVGSLFIIDRNVDYAAPLLTPLTYEGQLDETFSINCGYVVLGPEVTGKDQPTKLCLTSDDKVFDEIRDSHVVKAFEVVYKKVKELVVNTQKRQNMSVGELRQFVTTELSHHQQRNASVALHVNACDAIVKKTMNSGMKEQLTLEQDMVDGSSHQACLNYVEDSIILKFPKERTLRLLCLMSYAQDGFTSNVYQAMRTNFLHAYGHEHLITFHNLAKLKLLTEQEFKPGLSLPAPGKLVEKMASAISYYGGRSNFYTLTRKLNLVPKGDEDYKNPTNLSYVFSGAYIPLVCNLVQMVLDKEGFEGLEEVVKLLPGPNASNIKTKSARGSRGIPGSGGEVERVVIVCFLGGVTYAEMSAFRLLGMLRGYRFIIMTTAIINGNAIVEAAFPSTS